MKCMKKECCIVCIVTLAIALGILSPVLLLAHMWMNNPICQKMGRFHRIEVEWHIMSGCVVNVDGKLISLNTYIMKENK